MVFCGNVVELVEKKKVIKDEDFIQWRDTNINEIFNYDEIIIEVFIEKTIIPELELKPLILIDIATSQINGKRIGMLFIKKNSNVYG